MEYEDRGNSNTHRTVTIVEKPAALPTNCCMAYSVPPKLNRIWQCIGLLALRATLTAGNSGGNERILVAKTNRRRPTVGFRCNFATVDANLFSSLCFWDEFCHVFLSIFKQHGGIVLRGFLFGSAVLALLGVGTSAIAADLPTRKDPPPPIMANPAFSWTGFYLGIDAGWGDRRENNNYAAPGVPSPPGFIAADAAAISAGASNQLDSRGGAFGAVAGYNQQFGALVVGVEGDITWLGLSKSVGVTFPAPFAGPVVSSTSAKTEWVATIRPRAGFAIDRFFGYVTGGLALTQNNFSQTVVYSSTFTAAGTDTFTSNNVRAGVTLGAGLEYALSDHWSIKGEYLHVWIPSIDGTSTTHSPFFGLGTPVSYSHSVNASLDLGKIGVNYRF
jgi:outer membrane immunogenic protein